MAEREVFWNISYHWLFYMLAAIAVLVFLVGCYRSLYIWSQGWSSRRAVSGSQVVLTALRDIAGNAKILRGDLFGGLMHLFIMWGFFVLFLGTVLSAFDDYLIEFLHGSIYLVYSFVLDIFGILFLAGLVMALVRRYVIKSGRMHNLAEDPLVVVLLLVIGVSGFLVEGYRLAAKPEPWMSWSPVGMWLAGLLAGDPLRAHLTVWWTHALLSLFLIGYLPFSKLFHVLAGSITVALETLPPEVLTLEEREKVAQNFSRRHLIALDACTRCNRCETKCPSNLSGEALSPRGLNQKMKAHIRADYSPGRIVGRLLKRPVAPMPLEKAIAGEEAWMCTTCRACAEECPLTISTVDIIREIRVQKIAEGTHVPVMVGEALESVFKYGNPYQGPKNKRSDWAKGLTVADLSKGGGAEVLYFVGCGPSYDSRLQEIARSAVDVFTRMRLDFGILGKKEVCCGDVAKRLGEDGVLEELIVKNYESFEAAGCQQVVTTCPHGLKMLRDEYPVYKQKLGIETEGELRVEHYTELLSRLLREGKLSFSKRLEKRVTYHDPCYLGRHCGIFEQPREIIGAIPGVELVEMKRNRSNSFCCGGGGGRLWMDEFEAREKIDEIRARDAKDAGAELLITACPFCMSMLEDAVKTAGYEGTMEVRDLLEVVREQM